ncbi:polysaccharide export protein [bacterium]|jgi:protein involved in polysaccharide export with SLBB domain|nr:polysaccharide export protein [bacterium]MBT4291868.1 polysaccharide export protein [bacterium]
MFLMAGTRVKRVALFAVIVALCFSVLGCSSGPKGSRAPQLIEYNEAEIAARDAAKSARYRLHPGDVFNIDFKYMLNKDKLQFLRILPDGTVTCAGVGEVVAAGLTVSEFDSTLTELYAKDFRDAELSVILKEFASSKVYVFGEVQNPGHYELETLQEGLLQSLAMAGGFDTHADRSEVALIRLTEEGYIYYSVDLSHIEEASSISPLALRIRPNDIIYVPRSKIGDMSYKIRYLLEPVVSIQNLFWDIYAISNIDKVDRIIR